MRTVFLPRSMFEKVKTVMGDINDNSQPKRHFRKYHTTNGRPYDYSKEDSRITLECIEYLTANGFAVRLGKSRDGGVAAVGIYGDSAGPYTVYLRPNESLVEFLTGICDEISEHERRLENGRQILSAKVKDTPKTA